MAGIAALIASALNAERRAETTEIFHSEDLLGQPRLRRPLPPSTSPNEPGFHPRGYRRGPVGPVVVWLIWWSLLRAGEAQRAESLRRAALAGFSSGQFAENLEPFTGEHLGSDYQSSTAAAVVLDGLAHDG